MGTIRDEADISIHGVASRGQNSFAANGANARQSGRFDQMEPFFNSAGPALLAVMIDHPFAPSQPKDGIVASRKNRRVFNRYVALVVVAIERPCLELAARQGAFVHQDRK